MSCPRKNQHFDKKPPKTPEMRKKGQVYVWKEILGNPNLYCWVPISKKNVLPTDIDIEEINVQDLPLPPHNDDDISEIATRTEQNKHADSLRKLSNSDIKAHDLVSVDDPEKYSIVKKFIQDNQRKLYGGAAINYYLPREDKFYNPKDIPDYDFFSPDPWNDAVKLADIFHSEGYQYVEARAGIHKGTYKVFVNLWPVADVTYMPKKEFDMLQTKVIDGMKLVQPVKLLEAMYKEFSEPYSNPSRWPKVAGREKLLKKWVNPLNKKYKCSKDLFSGGVTKIDENFANVLEIVYKYFMDKKRLFSGTIAYNTYIEVGGGSKRLLNNHYKVLSETAHQDIQELITLIMKQYEHLETNVVYYPARELNNTGYKLYIIIENEHVLVAEIVNLSSCTPYKYIFNRYIVGIDYLKYELYHEASFSFNKQYIKDTLCKLQYLEKIQYNYYNVKKLKETDNSPFQRFVSTCKGPFTHNIKVEILNRWLDRVSRKGEVIKLFNKDWKIRKYPREQIPEECKKLSKDTCMYPCTWNKYIGRCTGLPRGIYRPSDQDEDMMYQYRSVDE